eukprot:CAMPEP_0117686544 /NCGR_PEP_ID=MMETSP0804-20121206/22522_1 /TAXON_ID=1074897 /ORGANISM="Tetraselmis astigmatica, Strain CCMP880" /LENGTH=37 /DNA_ID= /DNA_START= /DNA_END= /DNA_ORIENTATION=
MASRPAPVTGEDSTKNQAMGLCLWYHTLKALRCQSSM